MLRWRALGTLACGLVLEGCGWRYAGSATNLKPTFVVAERLADHVVVVVDTPSIDDCANRKGLARLVAQGLDKPGVALGEIECSNIIVLSPGELSRRFGEVGKVKGDLGSRPASAPFFTLPEEVRLRDYIFAAGDGRRFWERHGDAAIEIIEWRAASGRGTETTHRYRLESSADGRRYQMLEGSARGVLPPWLFAAREW